jgi:hypothetical protein
MLLEELEAEKFGTRRVFERFVTRRRGEEKRG